MKADPEKVEAVRQRIQNEIHDGDVRAVDPGGGEPVEFTITRPIGQNCVRVAFERFEDRETAEKILPAHPLRQASLRGSFWVTISDEIVFDD